MAQTFVTFVVDDTSPTISYSPFPDTFGTPDLSAGWNPYFTSSGFATTQGAVGQGTSQHITSLDGASLAFQWRGSGIKLMGNATHANYTIRINGNVTSLDTASPTDNVLLNLSGLPEALHNITLTASISSAQSLAPNTSSMVVFDEAVIFSSPIMPKLTNVGFNNSTLEDADIAFSGFWTVDPEPDTGITPRFHVSKTAGDKAFTMFNGSTLLVLGKTSPDAGNYTVILDGANSTTAVNQTFSAKSSFSQDDSLLFFASDLDPTVLHSVQVLNEDGSNISLAVGGFRAFVPYIIPSNNDTQPTPTADLSAKPAFERGTIAAFALAGILAFLLISGALFFFLVYRPRRRRRQQARQRARSSSFAHQNSVRPMGGESGERRFSEKGYQADNPPMISIAPMYDVKEEPDLEADSADNHPPGHTHAQEGPSNRFSAISEGFLRWTRGAVRGSTGSAGAAFGGLRFRHSDSPQSNIPQDSTPGSNDGSPAGSGGRQRPLSDISSWTETSSAARRRVEKRMGKMRAIVSRSWLPSPTYTAGAGSSDANGHRNSRRESRRQSRRASNLPSSAPFAGLAGAAAVGAAAERALHSQNDPARASQRRTLPAPAQSGPTRRPLEGTTETHEPPSYAASVSNSLSTPSSAATNPRSADPSLIIPPSISPSAADAANERDTVADTATASDIANVGHSTRTSILRPRDNLATVLAGPRPSAPPRINTAADRKDMRDVLRSLSPRTSSSPARQLPAPPSSSEPELSSRWMPSLTQPLALEALAEEQSPDSATSPTQKPLLSAVAGAPGTTEATSDPNRFVKKLPQTPNSPIGASSMTSSPTGSDEGSASIPFLRLQQPSPFRVDFPASRNPSLRPLPSPSGTPERAVKSFSVSGSSNPGYFTPSVISSVGQSSSVQAVEDAQPEGSSKRPFRFTALTFPTSSAVPTISSPQPLHGSEDSPPQAHSIDSFLDFTNWRDTSLHQPLQSERPAPRSLPVPPVVVEPQSRWSNTTVPTVTTTSYGADARQVFQDNESSGESQYLGIPGNLNDSRHFSASSTFPIPVQISIPPSPHHIMEHTPSPSGSSSISSGPPPPQYNRTSGATQGSGELHVHPAMIESIESPADTIPVSDSEIQFRHSFATESDPHAPIASGSGSQPHASVVDEFPTRPYDPSVLVSRVLGIPSPTSSMTTRPPVSHRRTASASTPSPSIPRSFLNSRSDFNSSNDRFNSGPGPSS